MSIATVLCLLLSGVIFLIVLGHVVVWLLYVPMAARLFREALWLPAPWREALERAGEPVVLHTDDGTRLEGTYLPTTARQRKGVIAFCHELNGNRWTTIPYTESLRQSGYDVFTFDFRNHGASDCITDFEPMPWVTGYDVSDVLAAVDYLCSRADADPHGVGILGISKGGTAALCAAARDPRVRALVIDGLVPTERMQIHYARRFMSIYAPCLCKWFARLPDVSFRLTAAVTRALVQRQRKCRFVNVDQAARRVRQPVMMIHGGRDGHIPVEVVRALRNSMPNGTRFWVIPDAKHNGGIAVAGEAYHRRIARFFDLHMGTVPPPRGVRRPLRLRRRPQPTLAPVGVNGNGSSARNRNGRPEGNRNGHVAANRNGTPS
ncbi:MAG TPA: alpha/beta fold hydrolase [Thermoguttaceae bacterium]|nr:alpha/beta fold hydrolase [Thermoguttaceae bacterium]